MFDPPLLGIKGGFYVLGEFDGGASILGKVFQTPFVSRLPIPIFKTNVSICGLAGDRIELQQHNKLPPVS